MVQYRGGKQFEPYDGAGEGGADADNQCVHHPGTKNQADTCGDTAENQRAKQGYQGGFPQQLEQFLGRQVEAEQEQQENYANAGDVLNQLGIRYQAETPGAEQRSHRQVGDNHGLAQVQSHRRQQSGTAEYQENRQ